MKLFEIKRQIQYKRSHSQKVGEIVTRTTKIKKYLWGLPIKTLHERSRRFHSDLTAGSDYTLFI